MNSIHINYISDGKSKSSAIKLILRILIVNVFALNVYEKTD